MVSLLLALMLWVPVQAQFVSTDAVSGMSVKDAPAAEVKPAEEIKPASEKPIKGKKRRKSNAASEAPKAEEARPADKPEEKPQPPADSKRRLSKDDAAKAAPELVQEAAAVAQKSAEEAKAAAEAKAAEDAKAAAAAEKAAKRDRKKVKAETAAAKPAPAPEAAPAPTEKTPKRPKVSAKPAAAVPVAEPDPAPQAAPVPAAAPVEKPSRRSKKKGKAGEPKKEEPEPAAAIAVSTPPAPPPALLPVLDVIWPKEKDAFPFVARSFTFGHTNPGASLSVNGQPLPVLPSGAFFAMVPFSTGAYNLDFEAKFSGVVISTRRVVQVAPANGVEPKPGEVLVLEPGEDVEARPGDLLNVRCKGAPGASASFSVGKLARDLPMAESTAPALGSYEGSLYLPAGDRREAQTVTCRLKGKGGGKGDAAGKVTLLDPLQTRTAVTVPRMTVLKSSEQGYSLFLPAGVRLEVVGRRGPMAHVRLSEHEDGWVEQKGLAFLAAGAPPPRAIVGRYITSKVSERSVRLSVSASERVAYEVRQTVEPLGFEVRFFNSRQRFDRMRFDSGDTVVRDARWRQESSEVVVLKVDTRLQWGWGYWAGYEEGGNFFLDIHRPPDLTKSDNVLSAVKVVIDPGHGPEASAVGPLGTTEREINLAIGLELESILKDEGAAVYMIRRSTEGPALGERAGLAEAAKGDLYVSIHNNALPVNSDPAEAPRGFMHFYYHPQSRRLAEAVEASYQRRQTELPDEGLHWGDLAVCRGTGMPAILTESAYVILPDQEERLRQASYQKKLAGSLLEGIRSYLQEYQRLQRRTKAEKSAAHPKQS